MNEDHPFEPMQGSLGNELTPCKHCGYARASISHTNRSPGLHAFQAQTRGDRCYTCGEDRGYSMHVGSAPRTVSAKEILAIDAHIAGLKYDSKKPRYDLLPPQAVEWIAIVLTYGAHKYAPDNWRKVDGWRWRYFSAAMRHLWKWQTGERYDPESTLPHLAHALCCLMFMLELDVQELPPEVRK